MGIQLSQDHFDRLVGILSQHGEWQTARSRIDFMSDVFAGSLRKADILAQLDLDGTPRGTAVRVIQRLTSFGQDEAGRESLGVLINKLIAYQGGGGDADFLRQLKGAVPLESLSPLRQEATIRKVRQEPLPRVSLAAASPQTNVEREDQASHVRFTQQAEDDPMATASTPKPVFICYAHADNEGADRAKRWLDRLKVHLQPLVQQDDIAVCSDQDIGPGDDWHANIQKDLNGARAAVLLVSPEFLASEYIRNSELPVLLRNAKERGVKVIPVILKPSLFEEAKFKYPDPQTGPEEFTLASLQAVGSPKKALIEMTEGEQDRALLEVVRALLKLAAAERGSSGGVMGERSSREETPSRESAAAGPLVAYRKSLLRDLSDRYQVDTRFVHLRLLDMVRSEHALQFQEQAKDYTDLRDVLADIPGRAMVLLGAPGCGKSTLLRRLQLDDAGERLSDGDDAVSLFVSLGAYPLDKDPAKDAPRPMDWLSEQWRRQARDLPELKALLDQRRVLLLLDALNEMPHRDGHDFRERVEKWRCFLRDDFADGNQAVFSCRSLDYSETLSVKDDLDVRQVRVQPLTPAQIEEFLRLYAADHSDGAWAEIKGNERLLELYSTPYFLKLLTDQLAYDPRVASERAALFTGFVRRALEREIAGRNPLFMQDGVLDARDRERIAQRGWSDAHDLPKRGALIPRLGALAYTMQQRFGGGDGKQVMVSLDDALALFDHPRAEDLLKAGEQLAVLDEERRTDRVRFFHQLLQEYFAARQLSQQPADAASLVRSEWRADRVMPSLAEKLATLQDFEPLPLPDPTGWEETAVLAAGMAPDPDAFVRNVGDANLALAARCATALKPTARVGRGTIEDLQRRLLARMTDPDADLRARIEAGLRLGELGDPRFERRSGPHGDYLMPPLIPVEADDYLVGDEESDQDDEKPAHKVSLAAFEIGQFLVTNAEFALFLGAGGYADERWWDTPAAKAWRSGEGAVEGQREDWRDWRRTLQGHPEEHWQGMVEQKRATTTQLQDWLTVRNWSDQEFEGWLREQFKEGEVYDKPRYWDDPTFNNPSQPVVGVCWHEARAYCAWLSAQTGTLFRLPCEAEWEAVARGLEGRQYAYPGEFDSALCNTFESHIRRTTPVGLFAWGSTPEGVADLTGNVWDWTSSAYLRYPYEVTPEREDPSVEARQRVVRGGSWDDNRADARAAYRYGYYPGFRDDHFGFRVVRAPAPVP